MLFLRYIKVQTALGAYYYAEHFSNVALVADGLARRLTRITGMRITPTQTIADLYRRRATREILRDLNRPDDREEQPTPAFGKVPSGLRGDLI